MRTHFPVSFSFTPICLTRCWGHSKWRLDGNGTAVEFGLLVGVPVLHQMAPVGWGLIGKEVSGQMLRGGRLYPDVGVKRSSRERQRHSWLLRTQSYPRSFQIRSQTELMIMLRGKLISSFHVFTFPFVLYFNFMLLSSIRTWLKEHSKGCESGPRLPGGYMPLQPWSEAAGLPSAPHRPARHLWHPPLGRRQRCQLPAVERATNTADPGHAEEG